MTNAESKEATLINVAPEITAACLRAIEVWGKPERLIQSMGECGEFQAAVGRYFQGRDPQLAEVIEEASDVIILMLQIRELVGVDNFDSVFKRKFQKFSSKVFEAKSKAV